MISKGLSDGLNRALMKTGYRPWLDFEDAAGTPWIFNPHFLTTLPWVSVPQAEAPFEWQAHFEMWYSMTIHSVFDVIEGANDCLCVLTKCRLPFIQLKEKLDGFFEVIPYLVWCYLRDNNYQFLYNFEDRNHQMQYGILYGPISLCQRDDNINIELSNTNRNGADILWRFTFVWGYNDVGDVVDLVNDVGANKYHLLSVDNAEEVDDGAYMPFLCSDARTPETTEVLPFKKTSYAIRVRCSMVDHIIENHSYFDANQAVVVACPWIDEMNDM